LIVKHSLILLFLALSGLFPVNGQESQTRVTGKVSYTTTQNIYAKFPTTEGIKAGDTIFRQMDGKLLPLFVVENISSVSCVGKPFEAGDVQLEDEVVARIPVKSEKIKASDEVQVVPPAVQDLPKIELDSVKSGDSFKRQQDIQGSLSVSSYSNLSNTDVPDSERMRYNLSLRALNLARSRLSAESYISFSHRSGDWASVRQNVFSALKIYSLSLKYDLSEKTNISLGRRVNTNLSNIGAVDGLQFQTTAGRFTMGAVAGSRPNDADYKINFKLLEYGAFIGHSVSNKMGRMQSSVAFFEQKNAGITDRRFVYFQHDNALLKNLSLFTSCELDLYKVVEGVPKNQPTLTGLYASLRYRMFKQLSVFASYDARKNVIYYETYKSFADRLLDEATRQGLQVRINYRPGNKVSMGVNGGYRFRTNDLNPNENLNGFLTISQVPWIKATTTISANLLKTSYLDGKIFEIRLSKDIIPGKLFSEFNYRFIDYSFTNSNSTLIQNIAQVNFSWQFKHKLSCSLDYEMTVEPANMYHRIYVSLSKRF